MPPAHLHGVGIIPFGRLDATLPTFARRAYDDLQARHLEAPRPDQLILSSQEPGPFAGIGNAATAIADALGLHGIAATRIDTAPSSGLAALTVAAALVESGRRQAVLVIGAETMTRVSTEEANRVLARMAHPLERNYGLTMGAQVAIMARAYIERHNITEAQLADCAVKAHEMGARNPYAHFRKVIDRETVLQSPMVADPLRLYHSAALSDGAAAVLVTPQGPVRVAGIGHATDALALTHRSGPDRLTHFAATRRAAREAFQQSGITAQDIGVVETHDAFTPMEGINLEDLGFFAKGTGIRAVAQGETRPGARVPANLGGGLKARGHPVGATGVAQLVELFWQLNDDPEVHDRRARAQPPRWGLAHNMGGLGNNVLVAVLEGTR